jgi:formylglycine-generating enzyme required for sulfatase activity
MGTNPSQNREQLAPVEQVSWNDVQLLLARLNRNSEGLGLKFILPTEAQWECACRAGTISSWHTGDNDASLSEFAWFKRNSGDKPHPVGQLKPNAWGLHDMHGNVWEWCADYFEADYYARSPSDDPSGPRSGTRRVVRGSCFAPGAWRARSATRGSSFPGIGKHTIGIRLACELVDD